MCSEEYMTKGNGGTQGSMTAEMILDYIGIRVDSNKAENLNFTVNLTVTDTGEIFTLRVKSGVVLYQKNVHSENADAAWTTPKDGIFAILSGHGAAAAKAIQSESNSELLAKLCENIVSFEYFFNIIES